MSEAVATYRSHADWDLRLADVTPNQKDRDLLRARARHLTTLADQLERKESGTPQM